MSPIAWPITPTLSQGARVQAMTMDSHTAAMLIREVRRFVDNEVMPVASELEHRDEYPQALIDQMRELGLFGATIGPSWGGLGLPMTVYAQIVEELARGWMSHSPAC